MADKNNIPKGKMHSKYRLLHKDIVCKITQRNNIRRANTCDPALKLLNEEITSDIQKHKQNIWKEHLDAHWDNRHNTHILWKIIHNISNRAPATTLNNSITFNKHSQTYCELFHARPCRIYEQSRPKIHTKALPMAMHPKVLGLTLDPNLIHSTHIHNISVHAHKHLQIIKNTHCNRIG